MNAAISEAWPLSQAKAPCSIRLAQPDDSRDLESMQHLSLRVIGRSSYSGEQIESFLRYTPTLDRVLIRDRTYYMATMDERLVGCGGWSLRAPSYSAAVRLAAPHADDAPAVPKVRAMYVHPDFVGRGIGKALLAHAERAMMAAGHDVAELDALLSGVGIYRRSGYLPVRQIYAQMPDGVCLPVIRMRKCLSADPRFAG